MSRLIAKADDGTVRVVENSPARSVLSSLLLADVPIRHDCGGIAYCGTCRIRVAGDAAGLSAIGTSERERLEAVKAPPGDRLACQARAARDIEFEILDSGKPGREGLGGHRGKE
ncbi:MAG: (2Fe-2S)-binding protein [Spirochaetales bacterium]|nr:(2Fe-2S)-binding protein [Spirochaetales bacterium]